MYKNHRFWQVDQIARAMKSGRKVEILDERINRWKENEKEGIFYLFWSDRDGWKLVQIRCCQDSKEFRTQIGYVDSEKYNVNAYVFLEARLMTQLRSGYFAGYSEELGDLIFDKNELKQILLPRMQEIESAADVRRILEAEGRKDAGDSDNGTK